MTAPDTPENRERWREALNQHIARKERIRALRTELAAARRAGKTTRHAQRQAQIRARKISPTAGAHPMPADNQLPEIPADLHRTVIALMLALSTEPPDEAALAVLLPDPPDPAQLTLLLAAALRIFSETGIQSVGIERWREHLTTTLQ